MRSSVHILLLLTLLSSVSFGQRISTDVPEYPYGMKPLERDQSIYWEGWRKVEVPFQYINDLIIVDIRLNNSAFPLKFIFDTGEEHTILTKVEIAHLLGMRYSRKFTIMGADMKTELYAYLIQNVNLKLDKLYSPREAILVLEEDYFRFEELAGVEIHGILGASFFRRFVLEIDYLNEKITFVKPRHFNKQQKKYKSFDIEIFKNKPYLYADMDMVGDSSQQIKLLVDTGASLPLLIYTDTDSSLTVPTNTIPGNVGRGLGGFLSGYRGRIRSLEFSDFELGNVVTSFQESDSMSMAKVVLNDRNGILGNQILSRFEVIIHYWDEKMYLRPNKHYKDQFKYDRSGLVILASGTELNEYTVQRVLENSPAAEAGLQAGDVIKKLNGLPIGALSMEGVNAVLQKRVGKKIRIVVKRGSKRQKFIFRLRELI
ncbi:MAG: aspartyl protease family protein [Bacteroidota bacterium]